MFSLIFCENGLVSRSIANNTWVRMDFPHEVRFYVGIGPAHFPAETGTSSHQRGNLASKTTGKWSEMKGTP